MRIRHTAIFPNFFALFITFGNAYSTKANILMRIPAEAKLYEHPMATFWFDELGILHSVSKPGARTIEIMDEYITFVSKLVNYKPVCILTDISKAGTMDKKTRDHTATQLQKVYKAMAIISETPVGKTIGKLFLHIEGQPYPTAMFDSEEEAKEWLIKYL